jgi:hypothetical protein
MKLKELKRYCVSKGLVVRNTESPSGVWITILFSIKDWFMPIHLLSITKGELESIDYSTLKDILRLRLYHAAVNKYGEKSGFYPPLLHCYKSL